MARISFAIVLAVCAVVSGGVYALRYPLMRIYTSDSSIIDLVARLTSCRIALGCPPLSALRLPLFAARTSRFLHLPLLVHAPRPVLHGAPFSMLCFVSVPRQCTL